MHILDIGCGKGAFLKKVQDKVASCVGLEFNDQAIEKAKKSGLDVRKEMIEDHAAANPEHYDLICFFQVLEHINEVKSFLDAAIKALKPGGLLIIGVPNSDPWLLKYDKYHTLNLPPHHAGLWNKSVFQTFEQYFPLQLKSIGYEPLTAIRQQWKLVLAHKNHHFLLKIVEKLPSFLFSILGKVIGPYFPGNSIVAVFTKK
jgi:2-polyprenyl-3-methyl-5-hydroxy-6-metoxy-1,4-benzoquinol methylase